MSMQRLSATISGRVQGVGFRDFTRRKAQELNLSGWVRNERNGSVRVEAEGDSEMLDKLYEALREGPRSARVAKVEAERGEATGAFDGFSVRY